MSVPVDLRGYGGKEKELADFFGHTIQRGHLHDAVDEKQRRYEYKKGVLAWLDLRKFVDLSADEASIVIRFVRFNPRTGEYVEHKDMTYSEVAKMLPSEALDAARLLRGTTTQIKHPFYPFRSVVRKEEIPDGTNGI